AADDFEPVAEQRRPLRGVVREEADAADPEVEQDRGSRPVVPLVRPEAEREVRLDRVEAGVVLQRVAPELVREPDAAALLTHVEDEAGALLGPDDLEGALELVAAVAPLRVEDVPG